MFRFKHYKSHDYSKSGPKPTIDVQRFERLMNDRDCSGVNPYNKPEGFYELESKKKYLTTDQSKGE